MGTAGVGLVVEPGKGGVFRVRDLLHDQPASRSQQLAVGDELQRIDGRDLLGMTLSQVCSLLAGSPGSTVSITARSAATRHKYVCKLVRQAAPRPAGPPAGLQPPAAAQVRTAASPAASSPAAVSLSPSKGPSRAGVGPRLTWHADASEVPREHDQSADAARCDGDRDGAACAAARANERLKGELLRVRQELLAAQQQQQAAELIKSQHENAIAILKTRAAELEEELDFEKRRSSKWKAEASVLPRLEEELQSLSQSFRARQADFARTLSNLVQQEQELRGMLRHQVEREQATVDSLIATERKGLREARAECEAIQARAMLTQEQMKHLQQETAHLQESHEAAMSRAQQNFSDREAKLVAMHADQEAKFKEHEETLRMMHSREIEALRAQNAEAHRQAAAADEALQAARTQFETAQQQQQESEAALNAEHKRVLNELKDAHAKVQNLTKNHEDQIDRVEKDFSERNSRAQQESEQRAHALAQEIEGLRHDHEARVQTLREELEQKKSREMQALQRDHEASVKALQKELENQRTGAHGIKSALEASRTELAVKEAAAKHELEEISAFLQAAAHNVEKLEHDMSMVSRDIREMAAGRNRDKAEAAAVLSTVGEMLAKTQDLETELSRRQGLETQIESLLMKTQDLESELSRRQGLEAQIKSLSSREMDLAFQSKSDIETLTAKQAEMIKTLVARAENEKQVLRAEMQKEMEEYNVAAEQEKVSLETRMQEEKETMKRDHDQTVQNLCKLKEQIACSAARERDLQRREVAKDMLLRSAQLCLHEMLQDSRDLSYEFAMAIDSQREAERCFTLAVTLELRSLVSWVQSTQVELNALVDSVSNESTPQVINLQPDFEVEECFSPGFLERDMEDRLLELEHSIQLSALDRDQQQVHIDRLENELTRLSTENLALQTAIVTQQQQLNERQKSARTIEEEIDRMMMIQTEKDRIIKTMQQVVEDAHGTATMLSEELTWLQSEVEHLKQSYAKELVGLESEHSPHALLATEATVDASATSQTIAAQPVAEPSFNRNTAGPAVISVELTSSTDVALSDEGPGPCITLEREDRFSNASKSDKDHADGLSSVRTLDLIQRLKASELKMNEAKMQAEVLQLQLRPVQEEMSEFFRLIMLEQRLDQKAAFVISKERLDHKAAFQTWRNSLSGILPSASARSITPTHSELSPSSLHGWRENVTVQSRSLDFDIFQRLRDPSSTIPSAQSFLQSPVVGLTSPCRRSQSAFFPSPKQDGNQRDGQEGEGIPANGRGFAETFSELYTSIELRRENQRLRAALEQSRSLSQSSRISHGERWQIARVLPEFSQTEMQVHSRDGSQSTGRQLPTLADLSPSHTDLRRELEQANKARDELLDTIQLQMGEIVQLHQRLGSVPPASEITLPTPETEDEIKASYDLANMQGMLNGTRDELEQSLIARDDLLR